MARFAFLEVFLFLVPFALFGLWRLLVLRGGALLDRTPWFALVLVGLGLACASFVVLAVLEPGALPGSAYVPPHVEDGRLVPGEFHPRAR